MDYIFATHNKGKMKEINALFAERGWDVRSLADFGLRYEAVEDGNTFTDNAIKKAVGCFEFLRANGWPSGHPSAVLADDSGLAIDALNGGPGVYSARFLGEDTHYDIKNRQLLAMLDQVPEPERAARFVCVIACVLPDGRVITTEGVVEGAVAREPRGENGFGYDPVFWLPAYQQTMAEILPEEKNRISHRSQALQAMLSRLAVL